MKIQGEKIILSVGAQPLALIRDVDIEIERDMTETASPSSSDAKTFLPGRYTWSINSAHLVGNLNQNTLLDYLLNKTALSMKIETKSDIPTTDKIVISGTAYLQSFKMGAPLHGFATANCSFKGSGAISRT